MLVRITLVIEVMSIILGIHRIYGEKNKFNLKTIICFILMVVILDLTNTFQLDASISNLSLLTGFVYCLLQYKEKVVHTIISYVIALIIVSITQLIGIFCTSIIPFKNIIACNLCATIISFVIMLWIIPLCQIDKLRKGILRRHWLISCIIVFITIVFGYFLLQRKANNEINLENYVFVIPAIIIIMLLIVFWDKSVSSEIAIEREMEAMLENSKKYDDLITEIRSNQHSLKNHLMALFSTHYTFKNYEQLLSVQDDYYQHLKSRNQYSSILIINNHTIEGFLYGKIVEIEKHGIEIVLNIKTDLDKCSMPDYYLIEILGILLDNALEATLSVEHKDVILLEIMQDKGVYKIIVRNVFRYVTYSEIESWYELNVSNKNKGQGIGLYRVKQICNDNKSKIVGRSIFLEEKYWIQFELVINKTEGEL